MGRMLEALKVIETQPGLSRPVPTTAVEEPAAVAEVENTAPQPIGDRDRSTPLDPRYRDVVGAVLAQVAVRSDMVLLVAGLADGEPRGGQLAALYPQLAAQVDGGVVVVDADLAGASLAERFDRRRDHGLADVLAGRAAWRDVVCKTEHAGLNLLPGKRGQNCFSGVGPTNRSQKRVLTPFSTLLAELRQHYRLVLVDTVLSTPGEMGPWATICDAVLLAARLEVTPRREVRQAIRAIRAQGGQILGCVLLEP